MRPTVVHYSDSAIFGGAERALQHLLTGLDKARWDLVLMHHGAPGLAPLLTGASAAGVRQVALPPMHRLRGVARTPAFARAVRAEHPAIFHAHLTWPLACKFGLVAARLARVPHVVATAQLYLPPRRTLTAALQHGVIAGAVDQVIAVSEEVAIRFRRELGLPARKIRVIPNAIPVEAFQDAGRRAGAASQDRKPTVLTVARLDSQKGLSDLIRAAAQVPEVRFLIAGEGPMRTLLESEIRAHGLEGRVELLGFRPDVAKLLWECDVFVLPSLFEGLPLSVLEAMAAGKPVIASRIGGTDEAVVHGETGLLVPPGDPAALAAAIRGLLADPATARAYGERGRDRVAREFSADRMVERVSAFYDELLAGDQLRARG